MRKIHISTASTFGVMFLSSILIILAVFAPTSHAAAEKVAMIEKTNADQRGTKNAPFVVDIFKTQQENRRSENEAEYAKQNAADTGSLFRATVVLAILAALQWVVMLWQGRWIKKQVMLGREEFNASHRPRIKIRSINTVDIKHSQPPVVEIYVINTGSTTATINDVLFTFSPRNRSNKKIDVKLPSITQPYTGKPMPPGNWATIPITNDCVLKDDVQYGMGFGSEELCFWGRIDYLDVNGISRHTGFFRVYNPDSHSFVHTQKDDEYADWEYEA